MATQVIILNGGSSSGKSGIARCLQTVLPDPWLAFGTDTLTEAMPALVAQGLSLADEAIGVGVVSQAIASARHETQYSRLFRS